jgi:hypothetical protein
MTSGDPIGSIKDSAKSRAADNPAKRPVSTTGAKLPVAGTGCRPNTTDGADAVDKPSEVGESTVPAGVDRKRALLDIPGRSPKDTAGSCTGTAPKENSRSTPGFSLTRP